MWLRRGSAKAFAHSQLLRAIQIHTQANIERKRKRKRVRDRVNLAVRCRPGSLPSGAGSREIWGRSTLTQHLSPTSPNLAREPLPHYFRSNYCKLHKPRAAVSKSTKCTTQQQSEGVNLPSSELS